MSYADGFVTAVPTENKDPYIKHGTLAAEMFKDFEALKVIETWGEDG